MKGKRVLRGKEYGKLLWFPLTLCWQELAAHLWAFGCKGNPRYILLFSLALGGVFDLFCRLFGHRGNRIAGGILTVLSTLWIGAQVVYFTIFRTFLTVYSVGGAGQVLQFWREALTGIGKSALPLLAVLTPAVVWFAVGRRFVPESRAGRKLLVGIVCFAAVCQLIGTAAVSLDRAGTLSTRYLYYQEFIPERAVERFGVLTALRLDLCQLLGIDRSGMVAEEPAEDPASGSDSSSADTSEEEPIVWEENVMEIDFDALAAEHTDKTLQKLDAWFAQRTPTRKNEYTGRFAGKNLIWFTAEGFSSLAVDEELTPTLYRLSHSGFVFENFYNPLWWASTTDGEYAACTGLIPKSGVWSLFRAGEAGNELYFCMGNQLRALGYDTRAYHNHTYTYYHRDVSHPNMGYNYVGLGNGLDVKPSWPESDLEMMELTLPEYVGDAPFHTYYMTVSGHMNYNFPGNTMATKHKEEVAHLSMSEGPRAYLACQMELDRALEYTLNYLEETGHLEDTVICLSGDHYPYGLEQSELNELAGKEVDMRFEVYHSTLILWCGDMEEPVQITKPCSSLDILPTLSNLFGLEYDSRLLMGWDILSDSEGLVVLSDRSFITDLGRYDSKADTFTPAPGRYASESYVNSVMTEVNSMFPNCKSILETDYYGKIGLSHGG